MKSNYQFKKPDFIPFFGLGQYQARNDTLFIDNESSASKAYRRFALLVGYNIVINALLILGACKGLESLIK